ncbi:MAG: LysE family translocator [Chitinophagaceae bacterium]
MLTALLKGVGLGFLLAISMGPIIFAIIKQSISNGHKAGYAFIIGVSLSDITVVFICNVFTNLFEAALKHQTFIAIVGSIFLLAAGIYTFFFKKEQVYDDAILNKAYKKREYIAIAAGGFFMNILNPGIFLFWLLWSTTILADSLTHENPFQYRLVVYITCLVFVFISDVAKVQLSNILRPKLTPKNMHHINQLSGLILMGFGIGLFIKEVIL